MSLPVPAEPLLPALGRAPSTAEELLREFYASRSPNTLAAYRQDVTAFARWARFNEAGTLGMHPALADDEIAATHVMAMLMAGGRGAATAALVRFRNEQIAEGLASATVSRRLTTLRALLAFARDVEMISWDVEVKNPRPEAARDMSGPTRDEAMAMLRHATERAVSRKGARDLAILSLLYDHGLRCGEVLTLDLEHVALDHEPRLMVLRKGRRHREPIALAPQAAARLAAWIAQRGPDPGPVFQGLGGRSGGRLVDFSVRRIVAKLARGAGVTRVVRPHGMRHSAATHLWRTTKDLLLVSQFLGHRNIATTQRYLDIHGEDLALRGAVLLAA